MGLSPKFHQLDIENMESIRKFGDFLKNTYGGIDVLVNNAGVYPKVTKIISNKIIRLLSLSLKDSTSN